MFSPFEIFFHIKLYVQLDLTSETLIYTLISLDADWFRYIIFYVEDPVYNSTLEGLYNILIIADLLQYLLQQKSIKVCRQISIFKTYFS